MLRNDKDDLISLHIVFAWMFKPIHESCYHMVKIRYCVQCSKKDEGKNEKVLRKNSKNMFKKEASQYPPKKLSVKWLRFASIALNKLSWELQRLSFKKYPYLVRKRRNPTSETKITFIDRNQWMRRPWTFYSWWKMWKGFPSLLHREDACVSYR